MAAVCYQEEGFSHIYLACAGSNAQHFINLLKSMFGEIDEPDLEDLETSTTKQMREQAATAEETNITSTEGPISQDGTTRVTVTHLPVPLEFGLHPDMYPMTDPVREASKKDPKKMTTKFYYTCCKCGKSSQNKISMFTHARRCFNIVLVCPNCQKTYESHDGVSKHISEMHGSCGVGQAVSSMV